MNKQTTRRLAALGITALAASVAGATARADSAAVPARQDAECIEGPAKVAFVPKLDTDPYFSTAQDGADEAAKELGGETVRQAPSVNTADAQIEIINALVSQRVDVIAIAGNDANALAPALERAAQQGVRVISYDSDVAPAARTLFVNQVDSDSVAVMMLDSIYDLVGGEGQIGILSSTPTATNQNAWIDSITKAIEEDDKYADLELIDEIFYGEEKEDESQTQALAMTQAYPDLAGMIVPAGISLPAAARALDDAGLLGQVKITGLAPASLIREYIEDGSTQDIWWNVTDLGYLTYYAANALATCEITGEEGETFEAGRLGEYTIGAEGEIILGPATIVTPENVEEFKF